MTDVILSVPIVLSSEQEDLAELEPKHVVTSNRVHNPVKFDGNMHMFKIMHVLICPIDSVLL